MFGVNLKFKNKYMKALFNFYRGEGNIGGDITDVFKTLIKNHTFFKNGDIVIAEYLINSIIDSSQVSLYINNGQIFTATNLANGNNILRAIFMLGQPDNHNSNGDEVRYYISLTNANGTTIISGENDPFFEIDTFIKLTLQDTSETPADNTVVAKMGTILYVPAS